MSERWSPGIHIGYRSGGLALAHCRQRFLLGPQGALFPCQWLQERGLPVLVEHVLGSFDGEPVRLLELERPVELMGCSWQTLRQLMLESDVETFKLLGYASQIGTWARQHRFCGSCGALMELLPGERAMHCPRCEVQHYPRLSPSMIVLVTRGDEVLLARSPHFASGVYSTLAGFVEPGETVEQCVVREVREEVGVEIRNPRYIASQSWPFPHSLMLGFHAEYAGGEIVPQPEEIEDARWFALTDLPTLPSTYSIARYLIELYRAQRLGLGEPSLPS
ncbi:NAD(+) diphosphatase [Azotobacter beijerinckii]|uniref:NAD(+) diphosphatase n=1 Tax=Azotobacter beijerinckii TaxID=170623 RepID=UPI00148079DE|nr:NAD(+) diphosphatase [Azotobacter beijerinckii]